MTTCPSCGFEITKCPQCGYATIFFPRHAPRGSGAHYANRIGRLTRTHQLALDALNFKGARSYETGIGLTDVWKTARDFAIAKGNRIPTKQGMSGRLSELAGLGMVRTESQVRLVAPESMQFRAGKAPRWFLAEQTGIYGAE
jgi:hypothetical protein